jgi:hypothetical protein
MPDILKHHPNQIWSIRPADQICTDMIYQIPKTNRQQY